jgi:hypothetical protein
LQLFDLFRDRPQACHVGVRVPATFVVVNDFEALSQRLRQVGQRTFHCVLPSFSNLLTSFGEQLAFRFDPI